ncbi:Glycerophosphodiester phosphodiesterase [Actinidia chinensis var. chinensis]|uniref:glycerophosphodiester phosphodiesterase n=1 Tax=Actinidia chinensis var. chinensis TaxID=1590841 RepID=A0A2R6RJM2_ACTCC|nr:Glycerophosphodiester phosphodiesterase [Actinidia chinensis var. chinensis]
MIARLFLVFLLFQSTYGNGGGHHRPQQSWLTLNGERPAVIARGGYSGAFPESSDMANQCALQSSLSDAILYCSLQLSKDGLGFCLSSLKLDNTTNIADTFPNAQKTYNVNGQEMQGYFALDYTADQLANLSLIQNLFSRPALFDGLYFPISTVEQVVKAQPPGFWLNVQYNDFYVQHKLDPALYIQDISKTLVFIFNGANEVEPTTNKKYGSILKDLPSIKLFASEILVPKEYIWPVNTQMYLDTPTSLVADAHKQGLKVYAYSFMNDNVASYNYSYDPTNEYLQFVDNSQFSVDGFLTDFPSTASEAIACLAQNKNASRVSKGLAWAATVGWWAAKDSGLDYVWLGYRAASRLDCFGLSGWPAVGLDWAAGSRLRLVYTVAAQGRGAASGLHRGKGKACCAEAGLHWDRGCWGLQWWLYRGVAGCSFARGLRLLAGLGTEVRLRLLLVPAADGCWNAAYLASKKDLSITDVAATALSNATFDKQSTQKVLIQSDDSAVLSKFCNVATYERVLFIKEEVSKVPKETLDEIKKFSNSVHLQQFSIIPTPNFFTTTSTGVAEEMHKNNISVYASVFSNEFVSIAQDYFSDPIIELATFISAPFFIDGVITEYPATATTYLRSPCSNKDAKLEYTILPIVPGEMVKSVSDSASLPPASVLAPTLNMADPPLHLVSNSGANGSASGAPNAAPATTATPPGANNQKANAVVLGPSLIAIMVLILVSIVF